MLDVSSEVVAALIAVLGTFGGVLAGGALARGRDRRLASAEWNMREILERRKVYEDLLAYLWDGVGIVNGAAKVASSRGWVVNAERIDAFAKGSTAMLARVALVGSYDVEVAAKAVDRLVGPALGRLQGGDRSQAVADAHQLGREMTVLHDALNDDLAAMGEILVRHFASPWERFVLWLRRLRTRVQSGD
jgi:hypothetical protein